VQLDRVFGEDLPHRPLRQFRQTRVSSGWPLIPRVRGQQPRRPQFVRIPQFLWLLGGQRHQPGSRLRSNGRVAAGARSVVQSSDHAQFGRSLKTSGNGLRRNPDRTRHRIGRGLCQIFQNDPRALNAAGWLRARSCDLLQLLPLCCITDPDAVPPWIPPDPNPHLLLPDFAKDDKTYRNILTIWNLYT
jgi:hypothetical protein